VTGAAALPGNRAGRLAADNWRVFLQLSFDLGQLDAEAVEEAARGYGASAVTLVDARDDPVLEPAPGEVRLWPTTRVSCLFPEHSDGSALVTALVAALGLDPADIEVEEIGDRLWEREWLRDFRPMRFGRRLWVRPRHAQVAEPDAVVVALDPGLAFGTGTHASTALCLEWLDAHFPDSPSPAEHSEARRAHGLDAHFPDSPSPIPRVIDYGCGSGILGIAAAKLGAAEVHAHDIDPQALTATRENAAANGVAARLQVHESAATLPAQADLLLANILSEPLRALAPHFAALVRPGGAVVLAGLMPGEETEVTGAYAACFDVTRFAERDGWVCLTGRRRGPSDADAA
jgi:ribosomal protein L11 methyltransferase